MLWLVFSLQNPEASSMNDKSLVRFKVWAAMLASWSGIIYSSWSYLAADFRIELMSPLQVGAFFFGLAAGMYLNNIKCERCNSKWYKTGYETYDNASSMLEFAQRFVTQRDFKVLKKCRVCGLERF
jgi:hypothetical protein